jgi:ribose transport system substrate-binding protein
MARPARIITAIVTMALVAGCWPSVQPSTDAPPTPATTPLPTGSATSPVDGGYHLGVSNAIPGNAWREQMICAIKAEATASGQVGEVTIVNRPTDVRGQIDDIRGLIAANVDAIILDPLDEALLNDVIDEAHEADIVVVAVDQPVSSANAYMVSIDQVEFGYIGAKWLAEELGGRGSILYMRAISGTWADDARNQGFARALSEYPDLRIARETHARLPVEPPAQVVAAVTTASPSFDAIWSVGDPIWSPGLSAAFVDHARTGDQAFKPIVGTDANTFVGYLGSEMAAGLVGAAITNPPAIGGAGVTLALDVLGGLQPERRTIIEPELWPNTTQDGVAALRAAHDPDLDPQYTVAYTIPDWTTYTAADLVACADVSAGS